jgi:hypothetical protein
MAILIIFVIKLVTVTSPILLYYPDGVVYWTTFIRIHCRHVLYVRYSITTNVAAGIMNADHVR